jgi:cytochrome c biogenesis protein CcmG, thiol:disulfide interchange protein DsbE
MRSSLHRFAYASACCCLFGCTSVATPAQAPTPAEGKPQAAGEGESRRARPPDFELESLSGESLRLSAATGQVILLDFWATFCEPCLTGMPHLESLYKRYRDRGFVVWGISIDGPESVAHVRSEVAKLGVTFPILLDDESRVVALYNPKTSAPFSVLIGRQGEILSQYEGYSEAATRALDADVEKALAR